METQQMEHSEQNQANILCSIESLLKAGKHDQATLQAQSQYTPRYWIEELNSLFEAYIPVKICERCGSELQAVWDKCSLKYCVNSCLVCRAEEIRKDISGLAEKIMSRCGVSKRFLGASIKDFPRSIQKIVKNEKSFFVHGPCGTGKTHLLAAALRHNIIEHPYTDGSDCNTQLICRYQRDNWPTFISALDMLLKIRNSFSGHGESEDDYINKYARNVDVLFLDDLGVEKPTDWAISTLSVLIDRRYRNELTTYISSNYSLEQIAQRLGDRIASRIAGMCQVIHLTGDDRRLQGE